MKLLVNLTALFLVAYLVFLILADRQRDLRMTESFKAQLESMRPTYGLTLSGKIFTPIITTGAYNTMICYMAGDTLTTGCNNMFFGLPPQTPAEWCEWINDWARTHPDFTVVSPITPAVMEKAFRTFPQLQRNLEHWQQYLAHYDPTDTYSNNLCIGIGTCPEIGTRVIDIRP